jgi:hypothetical protein
MTAPSEQLIAPSSKGKDMQSNSPLYNFLFVDLHEFSHTPSDGNPSQVTRSVIFAESGSEQLPRSFAMAFGKTNPVPDIPNFTREPVHDVIHLLKIGGHLSSTTVNILNRIVDSLSRSRPLNMKIADKARFCREYSQALAAHQSMSTTPDPLNIVGSTNEEAPMSTAPALLQQIDILSNHALETVGLQNLSAPERAKIALDFLAAGTALSRPARNMLFNAIQEQSPTSLDTTVKITEIDVIEAILKNSDEATLLILKGVLAKLRQYSSDQIISELKSRPEKSENALAFMNAGNKLTSDERASLFTLIGDEKAYPAAIAALYVKAASSPAPGG